MRGIVWALLALLAGGCSYTAKPISSPSFEVYSNYGEKVKGHYLMYVEATTLDTIAHPPGMSCGAHKYPIQIAGVFASSVEQTIGNVVDSKETVPSPLPAAELKGRNARGMIVIRGERTLASMQINPGFWSASMTARVEIVASVTVDGPPGRLLGTTVEGDGQAEGEAGLACEGGSKAFAAATELALRDITRKIGEAISNSERVRKGLVD